jgi:hypothetical protein
VSVLPNGPPQLFSRPRGRLPGRAPATRRAPPAQGRRLRPLRLVHMLPWPVRPQSRQATRAEMTGTRRDRGIFFCINAASWAASTTTALTGPQCPPHRRPLRLKPAVGTTDSSAQDNLLDDKCAPCVQFYTDKRRLVLLFLMGRGAGVPVGHAGAKMPCDFPLRRQMGWPPP